MRIKPPYLLRAPSNSRLAEGIRFHYVRSATLKPVSSLCTSAISSWQLYECFRRHVFQHPLSLLTASLSSLLLLALHEAFLDTTIGAMCLQRSANSSEIGHSCVFASAFIVQILR